MDLVRLLLSISIIILLALFRSRLAHGHALVEEPSSRVLPVPDASVQDDDYEVMYYEPSDEWIFQTDHSGYIYFLDTPSRYKYTVARYQPLKVGEHPNGDRSVLDKIISEIALRAWTPEHKFEVAVLYDLLLEKAGGLDRLTTSELIGLLWALSGHPVYQSRVLDVFKVLKQKGVIDEFELENFFRSEKTVGSSKLVAAICPHIGIEYRLEAYHSANYAVREAILKSFVRSELSRAMVVTASLEDHYLFDYFLRAAGNDKEVLDEALSYLEAETCDSSFIEQLREAIAMDHEDME